jgi:hypothetical protein
MMTESLQIYDAHQSKSTIKRLNLIQILQSNIETNEVGHTILRIKCIDHVYGWCTKQS